MKKVIIVAAVVGCLTVSLFKVRCALHTAYVKGCTTTATSFLNMLAISAPDKELSNLCSDIATKEGY